jgi:ATP-dependent protease Clp ATPase subunit
VTTAWSRSTIFLMQNVIKCSFCQKPQGVVRDEAANPRTLTVSICQDCLNVCRGILKKETKPGAESVRHRISSSRQDLAGPLCCSFCDTPQQIVDKLIGSPRGSTPTYICDKCVAAGVTTVEKETRHVGSWKNLWHWIARRFGIHTMVTRCSNWSPDPWQHRTSR